MFSFFYSASSHTFLKPRYISHILMRRCALTFTAYKFLDIGIVVGSTSHVEIAICDNRGNRIILPHVTWKAFIESHADVERLMQYEQRCNIYKMLRNEYKDNFISVGPLTIRVCTLNDATLVRLDSSSIHMTMAETTLRRMFAFDGCIDVTFEQLVRLVDTVDAKYTRFSNVASEDAIQDAKAVVSMGISSSSASYWL
ncbi:hypothetical protein ALC57_13161 [Trachymyrmex cornetzi]|uniref:Uncharacterized protein n=1 Tax=Trachymyrmex cornetzi TaxID=471704 RepID=A0A151IZZ5_9HYME|nr:hypothetical protein ALC57_13161 [Trachymyrmex cornetzi]